jgi:predicted RNA polymerase sigma factor
LPQEPEVQGLLALMEIQASRLPARTGADGAAVLLADQDRGRWDRLLIRRGLEAFSRAEGLGGAAGPYALQAAIAACHARAVSTQDTDWARIAALYSVLASVTPSPVIELNRAVAISMALGPASALPLVEALAADPQMQNYHLLPSVVGDLLHRLGRHSEAKQQFLRAATLTQNTRDQELLQRRARECAQAAGDRGPAADASD